MEKVNQDWLFQPTGDPFADTGAWALKYFSEVNSGEDILRLIERSAKIYINNWESKINPFFLNSTITQPAFKGERKLSETIKYFSGLLNETEPCINGSCRLLGYQTKVFIAGRDNHIMSGSGTFINFHHAFEPGVMLSKEALIRIFFVPLGAVFIGNKVGVIGSNQKELEQYFVKEIVNKNLTSIGQGTSSGIYKSPYGNPANTLFEFIAKWNTELNYEGVDEIQVNLFHFTNFGASPDIVIYPFSARLFKFYHSMLKGEVFEHWRRFIRSHYRPPKGAVYQEAYDAFFVEDKKNVHERAEEETVKGYYNPIYNTLLIGGNIRTMMLKWCIRQYQAQRSFKMFQIAKLYQQKLLDMKEETLNRIETIADIVISNQDKRKKWLNALMRVKNDSTLRDFLLDLMKEQLHEGSTEPVLRLRDYDKYFLSDGVYAKETRDLLLISVYEKLADQNIREEIDYSGDEEQEKQL
ncbi:MAG: type I-B CRISPR-associated protein Cas8b1/Cst1 [Saprospiraceae bacterium]